MMRVSFFDFADSLPSSKVLDCGHAIPIEEAPSCARGPC